MKIFRTEAKRDDGLPRPKAGRSEFGVSYETLSSAELRVWSPILADLHRRPALARSLVGPRSASLTAAYRIYFESLGGRFVTGDAATLGQFGLRLENHDSGRPARGQGSRRGARPLGRYGDEAARLLFPARRQARLSHALRRGRQCRQLNNWVLDAETRLFPRADAARHPPDDRRRIRHIAMRRRRRCSSTRAERVAREVFPLAEGSTRSRGWARAPARRT